MLRPVYTPHFRRDVKKVSSRGYDMAKLRAAIDMLLENRRPLPARFRDHALKGEWKVYREIHIEPDWLLVYRIRGEECAFARTGTHSDIFNE